MLCYSMKSSTSLYSTTSTWPYNFLFSFCLIFIKLINYFIFNQSISFFIKKINSFMILNSIKIKIINKKYTKSFYFGKKSFWKLLITTFARLSLRMLLFKLHWCICHRVHLSYFLNFLFLSLLNLVPQVIKIYISLSLFI